MLRDNHKRHQQRKGITTGDVYTVTDNSLSAPHKTQHISNAASCGGGASIPHLLYTICSTSGPFFSSLSVA